MGLEASAGPAAKAGGRRRDGAGPGARAGREGCRYDSPRLQDYSVRHAPRRSALRGGLRLGVCGISSWSGGFRDSGGRVWSAVMGRFPRPPYGCGSTIPERSNWGGGGPRIFS